MNKNENQKLKENTLEYQETISNDPNNKNINFSTIKYNLLDNFNYLKDIKNNYMEFNNKIEYIYKNNNFDCFNNLFIGIGEYLSNIKNFISSNILKYDIDNLLREVINFENVNPDYEIKIIFIKLIDVYNSLNSIYQFDLNLVNNFTLDYFIKAHDNIKDEIGFYITKLDQDINCNVDINLKCLKDKYFYFIHYINFLYANAGLALIEKLNFLKIKFNKYLKFKFINTNIENIIENLKYKNLNFEKITDNINKKFHENYFINLNISMKYVYDIFINNFEWLFKTENKLILNVKSDKSYKIYNNIKLIDNIQYGKELIHIKINDLLINNNVIIEIKKSIKYYENIYFKLSIIRNKIKLDNTYKNYKSIEEDINNKIEKYNNFLKFLKIFSIEFNSFIINLCLLIYNDKLLKEKSNLYIKFLLENLENKFKFIQSESKNLGLEFNLINIENLIFNKIKQYNNIYIIKESRLPDKLYFEKIKDYSINYLGKLVIYIKSLKKDISLNYDYENFKSDAIIDLNNLFNEFELNIENIEVNLILKNIELNDELIKIFINDWNTKNKNYRKILLNFFISFIYKTKFLIEIILRYISQFKHINLIKLVKFNFINKNLFQGNLNDIFINLRLNFFLLKSDLKKYFNKTENNIFIKIIKYIGKIWTYNYTKLLSIIEYYELLKNKHTYYISIINNIKINKNNPNLYKKLLDFILDFSNNFTLNLKNIDNTEFKIELSNNLKITKNLLKSNIIFVYLNNINNFQDIKNTLDSFQILKNNLNKSYKAYFIIIFKNKIILSHKYNFILGLLNSIYNRFKNGNIEKDEFIYYQNLL